MLLAVHLEPLVRVGHTLVSINVGLLLGVITFVTLMTTVSVWLGRKG